MAFREIEEGRAKAAYEFAKKGSEISKKKEYKSYVKNVPMYIKTNGLAATYAFIASKKSDDKGKAGYAYKLIYDQTKSWLENEPKGIISEELKGKDRDLAKVFTELDSYRYRIVTKEVLALFNWLRRFADELIEGE